MSTTVTLAYDYTLDELAPDTLIHCAGCDRDVEPHSLIACDNCGNDVCCASVETLNTGPATLCRRCNDALLVCDHCGEYAITLEEITSSDPSVGYGETQNVCAVCMPKRRAA